MLLLQLLLEWCQVVVIVVVGCDVLVVMVPMGRKAAERPNNEKSNTSGSIIAIMEDAPAPFFRVVMAVILISCTVRIWGPGSIEVNKKVLESK